MSAIQNFSNKDIKELAREARSQGWVVRQGGSNHIKWFPPKGKPISTSLSPSDVNAVRQIRRDLERSGLKLAPVHHKPKETEVDNPLDTLFAPPLAEKLPPVPDKQKRRRGIPEAVMGIIKKAYPNSVNRGEIQMRMNLVFNGIKETDLNNPLSKLTSEGKIKRVGVGVYTAVMAPQTVEQEVKVPTEAAPKAPQAPASIDPEGDRVLNNFLDAWSQLEKWVNMQRARAAKLQELKAMFDKVEL